MAKHKITVTVDEEVLAAIERLGVVNLSATVNNALIAEVDAAGHRQALGELLSFWDEKYGPVSAADLEMARAAFAELDGVELSRVA
jgi:post-segregation antitoxin (ccd killing protein)